MVEPGFLLIGGATHFKHVKPEHREKQQRMIQSTLNDLDEMQKFARQHAPPVRQVRGRTVQPANPVRRILLNEDFPREPHPAAQTSTYRHKSQVREQVRVFLQEDVAETLFLFLTGHGAQHRQGEAVQESFLIPTPPGHGDQYYTDSELTEDIVTFLPERKTLYVVIHACHSGGMLNFWEIDAKTKEVALFASAEADVSADWSSDKSSGFVKVFCKEAMRGKPLCNIAQNLVTELQDVARSVRPRFFPSRPEMAARPFLRGGGDALHPGKMKYV